MPDATPPPPSASSSVRRQLLGSGRFRFLGRDGDWWLKWHFEAHAAVSVVVLLLIVATLFREAAGFMPGNRANLELYRRAGLEYVDILRRQTEELTSIGRELGAVRLEWLRSMLDEGTAPAAANARLAELDRLAERLSDAGGNHQGLLSEMVEHASSVKERARIALDLEESRRILQAEASRSTQQRAAELQVEVGRLHVEPVNFEAEVQALTGRFPEVQEANRGLTKALAAILGSIPRTGEAAIDRRLSAVSDGIRRLLADIPEHELEMSRWRADKPVSAWESLHAFLFGRSWITASFWQDWYGVLPLFAGSFFISVISLAIAIPLGVCAAVYVNQLARPWEQRLIKPYIEFISAIPSVVLGFFGIAMLGETLRRVSQAEWLAWLPGFPMQERLTAFTAACLLALMAIPTIFTLAEDALQNVPRALKEASLALGATRLQSLVHIILPASLSGIAAAVLLGFGRVIGETMVVLLCAGNRIAIPDFSRGAGVVFQPVHTMTGIIAQEMGEVVRGSLHYRALFMVGCLLFLLSLAVNYTAQKIVRRYRLPGS